MSVSALSILHKRLLTSLGHYWRGRSGRNGRFRGNNRGISWHYRRFRGITGGCVGTAGDQLALPAVPWNHWRLRRNCRGINRSGPSAGMLGIVSGRGSCGACGGTGIHKRTRRAGFKRGCGGERGRVK